MNNAQASPAWLVTCMQHKGCKISSPSHSLPSCTFSPFPTAVWFNIFAKASPVVGTFGKPKAHHALEIAVLSQVGLNTDNI